MTLPNVIEFCCVTLVYYELWTMVNCRAFDKVGCQIGVGKESVAYDMLCMIMSLVQGHPLAQVKQLPNLEMVFERIIGLVVPLAEKGLIHCDFNQFNIMIDDDGKVNMIDFPHMVSVNHHNAEMYFNHDVKCIFEFFRKRDEDGKPCFSSIAKGGCFLDKELEASGFTRKDKGIKKTSRSWSLLKQPPVNAIDYLDHIGPSSEQNIDINYYEEDSEEENQQNSEAGQTNAPETHDAFDKEEDSQTMFTKDTELKRRLRNQNQCVIESMGGGWKTHGSRSTNKDKGHRSSHNSKIQKQLRSW
ncbi:hypothetical protein RGQ29_006712 [Quercus rubra]|uniref:non-specific serine/threonine protein kinase n=1 Tax=Quercus rubra TaxID=3512 RepID=A0AAN7E8U8_QUERU|nr:hypothetical protein RGQ29_006712 [Quercus rubra]